MSASTGLFFPTDSTVFKVEADFFQMQTAHAQQAIKVLSFISLAFHHEACLWAKLFFPYAHVRDKYRLEFKFPRADVICPCGISGQRRDRVLHATLEEQQGCCARVDQQPYWPVVQPRFYCDKRLACLECGCGSASFHRAETQSFGFVIDAETILAQHVQTNDGVNSPPQCRLKGRKVLHQDWNTFDARGANRNERKSGKRQRGLHTVADQDCFALSLAEAKGGRNSLIDDARVSPSVNNEGQILQGPDRPFDSHQVIPAEVNGKLNDGRNFSPWLSAILWISHLLRTCLTHTKTHLHLGCSD